MKPSTQPNRLSAFAVTAPGLEPLCAAELAAIGIRGKPQEGGVSWSGTIESVARANLWLRTASRVIVRIAEFRATAFFEVEKQARAIRWDRFVAPGSQAEFRVTCRKSKLYHSDAVAQRFGDALKRGVPGVRVGNADDAADDESQNTDQQLFVVRFNRDVCTVSVDTSGALLHLRGYRQQLAKAPLRETLAAMMLLGARWKGDTPLADVMCGSGTIPIEAALIARRMAPGRNRTFAFQRWPAADEKMWTSLTDDARRGELAKSPVEISGADRDAGAIVAARANAERAGVAADIMFTEQSISALSHAAPPGLVACNPPYGIRLGESDALRDLYAQLGNVLRRNRPGWTLALLSADPRLEQQTRLSFTESIRTSNGGIPVRLVVAHVPGPVVEADVPTHIVSSTT
ncbi:MAG TPA: class I SAM-dependent RNA methyltransferase [Gemmatimonadaceae bacterium]|nr:class I SAM-dependent RNA methyltransferase [Gemmatimonadaceae bacterium]